MATPVTPPAAMPRGTFVNYPALEKFITEKVNDYIIQDSSIQDSRRFSWEVHNKMAEDLNTVKRILLEEIRLCSIIQCSATEVQNTVRAGIAKIDQIYHAALKEHSTFISAKEAMSRNLKKSVETLKQEQKPPPADLEPYKSPEGAKPCPHK